MRKICFIVNVDWFYLSHRSDLVKSLSKKFSIDVIAGDSGAFTPNIFKFKVFKRIPTFGGLLRLRSLIRNHDSKTLFVVVSPVMIIIFKIFFSNNRNIIYNFSGLGFIRKLSKLGKLIFLKIITSRFLNSNEYFVVQNSDDYKLFSNEQNFDQSKLYLIPGSGFHNLKTHNNKNNNNLTIGFVGRISKDKGVLTLIKSVNNLICRGFKINLVIWGAIDYEGSHNFSSDEISFLQQNKKYLKGVSKNKELIFESFDVFCLPSNGEGLSKAAIEASSYHKPLLLSNVVGNRDMIDENGYLFEFGNVNDLSEKILILNSLSEFQFKKTGNKSKELFDQKWSFKRISNDWYNLLKNI
jgi:glycosyltransferase involved in cell wall biosynthesis